MFSFALYGRTGQGVRTASRILAKALFNSGYQVQCLIPYANGVQTGFVKIDKAPISSRELAEPDFFLIFDTKIDAKLKYAKKGAVIILNSKEKPKIKTKNKTMIFYINATEISISMTKKHMPNIIMIGALSKAFGKLPMKHMKNAIEEEGLGNQMQSLEEGFSSVKR